MEGQEAIEQLLELYPLFFQMRWHPLDLQSHHQACP